MLWLAFVLAFAAISYAARSESGRPDADVLYQPSTFVNYVIQYALIGAVIWAIAGLGSRRELFALRRPSSWGRATAIAVGVILGMYALSAALGPVLHPGREQGLTPTAWEPAHAAAYIVNGIAIAVLAPVFEELTFRGLGFSLLRRYGEWTAIIGVGFLFGLAHGLVQALPFLVAFGIGLAFLRSRTGSVFPGMIVHGFFNATALIFAVAH
ncbi:MAG: CPBP family intramembrane glutamic endopeptidase [Gaiellaceae bacterium]|jgi:uncharacterized protein|nr:CPBP family intramembrane metalloprotease [Acidobacteriota bacterium]